MDQQPQSDLKKALFQASDGILGAAILIVIGVYAGSWLDAKFHTSPWMTLGLSILGGTAGLIRLVQKTLAINSDPGSAPSAVKGKKSSREEGEETTRLPGRETWTDNQD